MNHLKARCAWPAFVLHVLRAAFIERPFFYCALAY
jgi:hypothetical protein